MSAPIKPILLGQFEAALAMLRECIEQCPAEYWDGPAPKHAIAKYPFWMVAYHTLCFVDCYLSPDNGAFQRVLDQGPRRPSPGSEPVDLHPRGVQELEDEYPSRTFSRAELLAYVSICHRKLIDALGDGPASESAEMLAGPSGFAWLALSRAELHLYNIRHVQHHTGQLGAFLRRVNPALQAQSSFRWVKTGWPAGTPA